MIGKIKKILVALLISSLMITGCSTKTEEINEVKVLGVIPRLQEDGILIQLEDKLEEDKFTGKAKLMCLDGNIYEGDFVEGLRTGVGKIISKDGNIIYEGNWKQNNMVGSGKLYYDSGAYFEGVFKNSMPWDGKYITRNGEIETVNEIKEGVFVTIDVSNDLSLKNNIQNLVEGCFGKLGLMSMSPFTEDRILTYFSWQYIMNDESEKYRYESDIPDRPFRFKVPKSVIDEYAKKYFDRDINHGQYFMEYYGLGYFYKDGYYYIDNLGGLGTEIIDFKVGPIYKINSNTVVAVINEYDEYDTSFLRLSSLIELEEKDNRYIVKDIKEIKEGNIQKVVSEIKNKNYDVNNLSDIKVINNEVQSHILFNNIKEIYGKLDSKYKTDDKVLDLISNDVDRHIESIFSKTINIDPNQINISSSFLKNHIGDIGKYKEEIDEYSQNIYETFKSIGINLKRKPSKTIMINVNNYSYKNDFNLNISSDIKELQSYVDKLVLNISGINVMFDTDLLNQELDKGNIIMHLNSVNDTYEIVFKDANGVIKDNITGTYDDDLKSITVNMN